MRDSNYRAVSNNKAALTITSSLYDRRALDVTSDKPLVNSLNYLTYLVSSSAKVRETLSTDGGVERLVEILHECHNCNHNLDDNDDKKLLTAWKWTLAFQCIVLVGTRGTEKIRQKVVKAGILPIIATVLDNYLSLHERAFLHVNTNSKLTDNIATTTTTTNTTNTTMSPVENIFSQNHQSQPQSESFLFRNFSQTEEEAHMQSAANPLLTNVAYQGEVQETMAAIAATSLSSFDFDNMNRIHSNDLNTTDLTIDDYESSSVEQLFRLLRLANLEGDDRISDSQSSSIFNTLVSEDVKRGFVVLNILNRLRETKEAEAPKDGFVNDCEYDMDSNLNFLSKLYARDLEINDTMSNTKLAVRAFSETGVIIPKDDDIVWSLQLLAYISKYPYLKEIIQNTHLVLDMSIRDKSFKIYLENQMKLKMKEALAIKLRPTITPKTRKPKATYLERFSPSASNSPQMVSALNDDNLILSRDKFVLCETGLSVSSEVKEERERENGDEEEEGDEEGDEDDDDDDVDDNDNDNDTSEDVYDVSKKRQRQRQKEDEKGNNNDKGNFGGTTSDSEESPAAGLMTCHNYMRELHDLISECEKMSDEFEREVKFYQLFDRINRYIEMESKKLSTAVIETRLKTKDYLEKKWKYEDYKYFNIDEFDEDKDDSLIEYKKVNLFPIVEKFTFFSGSDMYYWSGVIMRNSCRRNDLKGGVRQCGNLECGKWEKYPREFSKCRRCKRTKYCSRDCQMRAWHCHRNWCIPSTSSSSSINNNNTTTTTTTTTTTNSSIHTQQDSGVIGNDNNNSINNIHNNIHNNNNNNNNNNSTLEDNASQIGSEGVADDEHESPMELQ
ncbi:samB [Candida oxycetoniae]|uniref:SamB n=1 Tax=Candida oxycetoniae TaxID=497107 RepID=A0AAI9T1A0_9ASCO|nr:samB [Candida oxycetoniae]KAI3406195.2 samB [Candida oxycetoniae]